MNNRILRKNPEQVNFEPVGYLDAEGAKDPFLLEIVLTGWLDNTRYDILADILHSHRYATSKTYKMRITGANLSRFMIDRFGLKKHKDHHKKNYQGMNIAVVKGLKRRDKFDVMQKAKFSTKNYRKRLVVMLDENIVGRDSKISNKDLSEKRIKMKEFLKICDTPKKQAKTYAEQVSFAKSMLERIKKHNEKNSSH